VGAYIGGLVYCVLDNYFCKLLEKNKYTQIGQNFLEFASYNLVALISIIILGFIVYTKSENAGTWMLIAQTVFSLFSASLIRERNIRTNNLPTGLGLLIGTPLAVFLISFTYPQSYALATIVGIFSFIIVAMVTKTVEEVFSLIEQSSKNLDSLKEEI
jgi:Ni,Fe-hydrogenase I cytochrome b subunit